MPEIKLIAHDVMNSHHGTLMEEESVPNQLIVVAEIRGEFNDAPGERSLGRAYEENKHGGIEGVSSLRYLSCETFSPFATNRSSPPAHASYLCGKLCIRKQS